jgi:hypothetical protein
VLTLLEEAIPGSVSVAAPSDTGAASPASPVQSGRLQFASVDPLAAGNAP